MIERKTSLHSVEICRNGHVAVLIALSLVEDGREIKVDWHRTALAPDSDAIFQMVAVNAHLESFDPPMPPVPDKDIARVEAHFKLMKELADDDL